MSRNAGGLRAGAHALKDIGSAWGELLAQLLRDRRLILLLFAIQVVAYSYLYTAISFGNHLFPNAFINPYPSFRTTSQGRWLLDLILVGQGGSGVQSVQMIAASLLQACNATLFLRLIGVRKNLDLVILGCLFCLYPHFLDYYSFTSDHFALVGGDSLALLGMVFLYRCRSLNARLLAASTCWFLALSIYAPKLALLCLLLVLMPVIGLLWADPRHRQETISAVNTSTSQLDSTRVWPGPIDRSPSHGPAEDNPNHTLAPDLAARLGQGVLALLLAVVAFWLSSKLSISNPWPDHTHLNSPAEALSELNRSYRRWRELMTTMIGGLISPKVVLIPALLAYALLIFRAVKQGWATTLLIACLLALIPVALQSTWIVNGQAWQSSGRLLTAYAYLLVFYLAVIISSRRLRLLAIIASSLLAWSCFVFASQASNAIQIKSAYELGQINRIAARVEPLLTNSTTDHPPTDHTPLVIFGMYPKFNSKDYIRTITVNASDLVDATAFASYRQVDILNQILGSRRFRPPTASEVAQARQAAAKAQPWPAPGSVFREGETIVVVLEPDRPGGDVTGQPSEGTSGKPDPDS